VHNVVALSGLSEIRPASVTMRGPSIMPAVFLGAGADEPVSEEPPLIRLNPYLLAASLIGLAIGIGYWRSRR
jgi:hypothetical protein